MGVDFFICLDNTVRNEHKWQARWKQQKKQLEEERAAKASQPPTALSLASLPGMHNSGGASRPCSTAAASSIRTRSASSSALSAAGSAAMVAAGSSTGFPKQTRSPYIFLRSFDAAADAANAGSNARGGLNAGSGATRRS
eukprot:TRINITY_DN8246_c0_g1_i1.p2 TRINITY_DN8246_c0_g1~~TRINITY_DN8246_c0_g1_i1.p2  ORF type:complete len:140 (-),score=24.98 TRINITY_DN8246_c0_g1_i1:164-583(-)